MAINLQPNEHNPAEEDITFKIVLIGDSKVGKTAILLMFAEGSFDANGTANIGVCSITKHIMWDGQTVKLQIWDTAGQERFAKLAPVYCRKADAVLMCYDITNLESFQNVENWYLKSKIPMIAELVLVGNKIDSDEIRVITTAMGQEKADTLRTRGIRFFETSAKTNANIDEVFKYLVGQLMSVRDACHLGSDDEVRIILEDQPQIPESKCCSS